MKSAKDLRYLFIARILYGGGAERFVTTFASYMAEQGYDVHVLAYDVTEKDYPLSDKVKLHVMKHVEDNLPGKFLRMSRMIQEQAKIQADVLIPFLLCGVLCVPCESADGKEICLYATEFTLESGWRTLFPADRKESRCHHAAEPGTAGVFSGIL